MPNAFLISLKSSAHLPESMPQSPEIGVLLINIGTPDQPQTRSVRRFLTRFLSDKRVISINVLARFLLVRCIIAPFRSPRSAGEYQRIWTAEGSPLTVHSQRYAEGLQRALGGEFAVHQAMRYSHPDIAHTLAQMQAQQYRQLIILPLYPQNASSTTGSTVEEAFAHIAKWGSIPGISLIPPFYDSPQFVRSFAQNIAAYNITDYDAVLFSYHGLPESHLPECIANCSGKECTSSDPLTRRHCYKYQCLATTQLLAREAGIPEEKVHSSFQSRLSAKWITPFTDSVVLQLLGEGRSRLLVVCPAFAVDCLETVGEIGIHLRQTFMDAGGTQFDLVPCLNASAHWVEASAELIRTYAQASPSHD